MATISKKSVKEQVYEVIKQKIFDREYQFGDTINITTLCRELGVSNTPTREALSRLEAEGLVRSTMSSKVEVISLDEKIFNEISYFFYSQVIGAFMFCQMKNKLPLLLALMEGALEKQKAALYDKDESSFVSKAIEFDRCFILAAENETMLRIYDSQSSLLYLLTRYTYDKKTNSREENLKQHEEIMKVIKAGDISKIQQIIFNHFDKHI